jgi:H+/gluconate symporter-like permease
VPFTGLLIVVAVALLIVLSLKGWDIILVVFLCSLIISIGYEGGIISGFIDVFAVNAGGYFGSAVLLYLMSGVYAYVYTKSGCAERLGRSVIKWFHPKFAPYAIFVGSFLLGNAGVGSSMFILAPVAFALFKAADLPLTLALISMVATSLICIPGSTAVTNVLLANIFTGSDLLNNVPLTIIRCIIAAVCFIIYMEILLKKFKKEGRGYTPTAVSGQSLSEEWTDENMPSFLVAVTPLILVLVVVFVLQLGFGVDNTPTTIIAQILGVVFMLVTCPKQMKRDGEKLNKGFSKGLRMTFEPLMMVVCIVGFASLIGTLSAYTSVSDWISGLNMHPYVTIVVATMVTSCIMADSVTGSITAAQTFGVKLIEQGADPKVLHYLCLTASSTFDTMPHSVPINICMMVLGEDHKDYPYLVISNIVIPVIYTVITLIIALIFF